MRVGIVCNREGMTFLEDIIPELRLNHLVEVINEPFTFNRIYNVCSRVDVLFVEWVWNYIAISPFLRGNCKIVVRGHFSDLRDRKVDYVDWSNVDLLIFTNNFLRDEFFKNHPKVRVASRVIRLGVNLDFFRLKPDRYDKTIGFVGFIKPVKDPIPVINMMKTLQDWKLILKSTPSYYNTLTNQVAKIVSETRNVTWIKEWMPRNMLPSFYHSLDILVNNSVAEGQGMAILEAMACGVYPVIRHWKHAEELYPEQFLFNTIEECREKIIDWGRLSNEEKRRLSIYVREYVENNYNGKRYVREIIEALST